MSNPIFIVFACDAWKATDSMRLVSATTSRAIKYLRHQQQPQIRYYNRCRGWRDVTEERRCKNGIHYH